MRVTKMSFRNKRKRSTRIDFTHRTFAEKGGGGGGLLKKACITKEKGRPVLTLHTGLLLKRGGGSLGTRICVPLNNTEWGGRDHSAH